MSDKTQWCADCKEREDKIKQLSESLARATNEIERLHTVIDEHVKNEAGIITEQYAGDAFTQVIDGPAMRTTVRLRPRSPEFVLARGLTGWSDDHREAFGRQITKTVSEMIREDVFRSIWDAA